MRNTISLIIAAVALLCLLMQTALAQSDEHKFEAGGQFTLLNMRTRSVSDIAIITDRKTIPGIGGRFGYNISKYFAVEAEANFFSRDRAIEGGQKIEGLFGVKVGKRLDKVGIFAKARPGFVHFEKGDYRQRGGCPTVFPPPLGCFESVSRTDFALDLGGIVEFYPSKRTILRFDAGDTIIRFGPRNVAASSPVFSLVAVPVPAETTHNFQGSIGFGFRF